MPTLNKKSVRLFHTRKNYNKKKTEKNKKRHRYYSMKAWRQLRKNYLSTHPLCEMCEEGGKIRLAEDVHHIKSPFNEDYTEEETLYLLLNYNNLKALCKECHGTLHRKEQEEKKKRKNLY